MKGPKQARRGIALVPTLLVVSGMALFTMALMTTVLTGKRTVNSQSDEYRLSSAVESVAILSTETLWSGYLANEGGAAGTIDTFRAYMDGLGVLSDPGAGPPDINDGIDLLPLLGMPVNGGPEFNGVNIDAVQVVRRDAFDSTQLYLSIQASTKRGDGLVNPVLNRAVQQVWTIEPDDFTGFEFAMLANNVNCIFCHAQVESTESYFLEDGSGPYDRVKVGMLGTFLLRHNADGNTGALNDHDSDSFIAGTFYSRGPAFNEDGTEITNWPDQSFHSFAFDASGQFAFDAFGDPPLSAFLPAGDPPQGGENMYLNYPTDYSVMESTDGVMPVSFPAPIPDDGGQGADPASVGNRIVDDIEFDTTAASAEGAITAGVLNVTPPGGSISTLGEYANAFFTGNQSSLPSSVDGHVILTGTWDNPITIDGTVAIDGDLIINGYIKGEGSLIVRGNVYVPTNLQYLDGRSYLPGDVAGVPTGPRTFGVAQDGTKNVLGLAAGGNILIGDYLKPSSLQPDGSWDFSGVNDVVSGDSTGDFSFSLSQMAMFNRDEWAKTQQFLPDDPGELDSDPATWPAIGKLNPNYDPDYVPRYYGHGPGDEIPIWNRGDHYYDPVNDVWWTGTDPLDHLPLAWDTDRLTFADPNDSSDPILFNLDGTPRAVTSTITPSGAWLDDNLYKASVLYFQGVHTPGEPMKIDGLLYTNNSIFTLVSRFSPMAGQVIINGSLVAADLGMLAPGYNDWGGTATNRSHGSSFAIGLQLNYDQRVRNLLNVRNPFQVQLKRTLWNPTANMM